MSAEKLRELKTLASVCPELNMANYGEDDVRHLNDWAIEMSLLVEQYALSQQPAQATQAEVTDEQRKTVDQIMEQAQVFALAWALVGGRFDSGDALDDAHEAKEELREIVSRAILAQRPQAVPMTDEQAIEMNDAAFDKYMTQDARAIELVRSVEAHHRFTAQAKKGTP